MTGNIKDEVVISFILSQLAVSNHTACISSKAAVEDLTRAMALELARYQVRVNAVSPGMIRNEALMDEFKTPEIQTEIQSYIPDGRFGETLELAEAVLSLASDAARYINGAILQVDGGLSIRESGLP